MNLHTIHILNDKLQAAIQSENLERIRTTLDEMKTEIGEIERRKVLNEAREKERKSHDA